MSRRRMVDRSSLIGSRCWPRPPRSLRRQQATRLHPWSLSRIGHFPNATAFSRPRPPAPGLFRLVCAQGDAPKKSSTSERSADALSCSRNVPATRGASSCDFSGRASGWPAATKRQALLPGQPPGKAHRRVCRLAFPTLCRRRLSLACPLPAFAPHRGHRPLAYCRSGHYRGGAISHGL